MTEEIQKTANEYNRKRGKRQILHRIMSVLMCATMFVTTYVLILPAATLDVDEAAVCGLVHHRHSEDCYGEDGTLVCGLPEHEHDMACFVPARLPELYSCGHYYEHTHTDACYRNGRLICSYVEHTHT